MEELILFIISFILVLVFYEMFFISPLRINRDGKKRTKKKDKELLEIKYLQGRYKLNLEKVNYNKLLQICALTSSFDIALIVSILGIIKNYFLILLCGIVITILIILISYHIVYIFYKKKGMILDE